MINISALFHVPVQPLTLLTLLLELALQAGNSELIPLNRIHTGIQHIPNVVLPIAHEANRALFNYVLLV
jgi:hypothetical protein